ncbi:FKBP-type peptidyl-prolyl cis-trans isomerase [Elusimicrobiota bacterium]
MILRILVVSIFMTIAAAAGHAKDPALKTDTQKTLYSLGTMVGSDLATQYMLEPGEARFVAMGVQDAIEGKKFRSKVQDYRAKISDLRKDRLNSKNKDFLDKAAKEKGAKKFPSGLIYKVIKSGKGASPKATDKVKVHYHGTFPDGKVFDSSVERNKPAEFPLNGVIKCWTEGVQKMQVGEKAQLICPYDIAYGERGRGGIPAFATLIFEVELLAIK